jgi:hypothetical protein
MSTYSQQQWQDEYEDQPIRLLITCRRAGYEPWALLREVAAGAGPEERKQAWCPAKFAVAREGPDFLHKTTMHAEYDGHRTGRVAAGLSKMAESGPAAGPRRPSWLDNFLDQCDHHRAPAERPPPSRCAQTRRHGGHPGPCA